MKIEMMPANEVRPAYLQVVNDDDALIANVVPGDRVKLNFSNGQTWWLTSESPYFNNGEIFWLTNASPLILMYPKAKWWKRLKIAWLFLWRKNQ